ncbi:hypothetical protein DC3_25790 [Deinococcus cellulosilyticus NBRC 106333 = KACC 11606]|uniref:Uncharacterized protein n=1 Tax=Deinococcus cellulosilyticus (strain DSM 18568 / NBRC 106333 / KACC 11606 / 5516J-15) TaxID=1223518 RepID=A0A511N261_DEIC1|nr:hypothetical protein DC3_25790 [Deinococcus cellulosilyticus NBRC 106333 = KACC 11606]
MVDQHRDLLEHGAPLGLDGLESLAVYPVASYTPVNKPHLIAEKQHHREKC